MASLLICLTPMAICPSCQSPHTACFATHQLFSTQAFAHIPSRIHHLLAQIAPSNVVYTGLSLQLLCRAPSAHRSSGTPTAVCAVPPHSPSASSPTAPCNFSRDHSLQDRFKSLHANMVSSLQQLHHANHSRSQRPPALEPLQRAAAAYVPYYVPPQQVLGVLCSWPDGMVAHSNGYGPNGGEGLQDYVVTEMAVLMHDISSVKGLLRYLQGVEPALLYSEQWKGDVGMVPLLRLQGELYSLTLPGGPRCARPHLLTQGSFCIIYLCWFRNLLQLMLHRVPGLHGACCFTGVSTRCSNGLTLLGCSGGSPHSAVAMGARKGCALPCDVLLNAQSHAGR